MDFLKSNAINTGFVAGFGSGKSYVSTLKTIIKKYLFLNVQSLIIYLLMGLLEILLLRNFRIMLSEMGYKYKL